MSRASRWYAAAAALTGAIALWAKYRWMELRGFQVVARAIGRAHLSTLTTLERAMYFRRDVLVGLVVLPALVLLAARIVRPRWRAPLVASLCTLICLLFYAQIRAQDSVGGFLRAGLMIAAARFGLQRPDYIKAYIHVFGLIKLAGAIAVIIVTALWAKRRDRLQPARTARDLAIPLGLAIAAALAAALPLAHETAFHDSLLLDAMGAYARPAYGVSTRAWTPAQLTAAYRALAVPVMPHRDNAWFGRAKDADLIIYVLETAPLRCLDSARAHKVMANVDRLRAHAIAARSHYTTYPYTSLALFSMFTGWYPPPPGQAYLERHPHAALPGVIRSLRAHGYATTIYAASRSRFEDDTRYFDAEGFEHQYYVDPTPTPSGGFGTTAAGDSAALQQMKKDMEGWIAGGRRYAAVFHPEIGHAPWPLPDRAHPDTQQIDRCRAILQIQDLWLGEIREVLERHGRAGHTLIVFTGDHGIRTREEDPSFVGGNLDRYSFRVPLIIGMPGLVDTTVLITRVTSHIDLTPTLLDLLGIEDGRAFEQGAALWDSSINRRTTFMFAGEYLGADGFHRDGRYAAYQRPLDLAWSARDLRFTAGDVVPTDSKLRDSIVSTLATMAEIRQAWLATLSDSAALGPMRRDSSR